MRQSDCAFSPAPTTISRVKATSKNITPELKKDLLSWTLLDDEALRAIANAFLPAKKQRRFTTLLRKAETGQLNAREQSEWKKLQQEYLRLSQNKAKALFLLAQREDANQLEGL